VTDLVYRRWLADDEDSAMRFAMLSDMAATAVSEVALTRANRRLSCYEAGDTAAEVDELSADTLDALRSELRRFKVWPFRWRNWHDAFDPVRLDDLREPALVRAAVWDLWRDYEDWPTWRQVVDRLVTSLGISSADASDAVVVAASTPDTGVHAVYPSHLFSRVHRCDDMADFRWIIEEDFMAEEETKYQWRALLGEDGLRYRTAITLLMDPPLPLVA
jgi:hypothetical protein